MLQKGTLNIGGTGSLNVIPHEVMSSGSRSSGIQIKDSGSLIISGKAKVTTTGGSGVRSYGVYIDGTYLSCSVKEKGSLYAIGGASFASGGVYVSSSSGSSKILVEEAGWKLLQVTIL